VQNGNLDVGKKTIERKVDNIWRNRQRVLLLSSRGILHRHRHFMKDLEILLPHCKKEAKFDTKGDVQLLNEIAELHDCNNSIYLEVRKHEDLYMWLSKTPHGPSVKFHVQNLHTMDELKLTGNCLKGSRPLLSFDKNFDEGPEHFRLIKNLLIQTFGTPKGHRKSKPFFDHLFSFTIIDDRIWFRNYQLIRDEQSNNNSNNNGGSNKISSLVEIGPRFTLHTIRIFDGSFGGPTLYENDQFVHPNVIRAERKKEEAMKYASRVRQNTERKLKMKDAIFKGEMDDVDHIFR
jgi:ribosome biogenesis protein BRX1